MKISDHWLREWVVPRLEPRALAERLTLAGLEVASVQPALPSLTGVLVGAIESVTPHPNADRLTVCTVNAGKRKLRVVCGAPNVAVGMRAPLAMLGATVANGKVIERVTIQGVESEGMLCSAADLGLGDDASGLWALDAKAHAGTPLAAYLGGDDVVYDIELTPNRGDCLSVLGIAREVSALTGAALKMPRAQRARTTIRDRRTVRVRAPADCPRYTGRMIRQIRTDAQTPTWMRERLRRAGVRAIHPVVDVMNYVMLELGQPMHAFDLDKLDGGIVVRPAAAGEPLTLLDGKTVQVAAGTLVIADQARPLALAGVMGGFDSAVGAATQNLFLESAFFRPQAIARSARALNLQTESSQRFERGVDPALAGAALERATVLLLQIVGGEAGPIVAASSARHLPMPPTIVLRASRIETLLGAPIPAKQVAVTLGRQAMTVRKAAGGWRVRPPSYRFDLALEADLIEELARVQGYESLPAYLPMTTTAARVTPETKVDMARLRTVLVDRDYQEVITYSFVDPALQSAVEPTVSALRLANPISAEMAVMRTSLWPGLLQTIAYNQNRQQNRLRLFEIGRRFLSTGSDVEQESVLAGAVTGAAWPEQWGASPRAADFYDIKGDLEALFGLSRQDACFTGARHSALHPGQSAAIHCGEEFVGYVGTAHPGLVASLGLAQPVVLFELRLAPLSTRTLPRFMEISRFPGIRRDVAVVVDETVTAQSVVDRVAKVAGKLLVKLELFDEYRGEGIDSGRKSLAMGLTLQDSSRTLKEAEVDEVIGRIITVLQDDLGAQRR